MRIRLVFLATTALIGAASAARAAPNTCPQGTTSTTPTTQFSTDIDGCLGAPPDGVFTVPAFFTGGPTNGVYQPGIARQSGQAPYPHRPSFNVTAVDFGIAYSPSQIAVDLMAYPQLANAAGTFKDPAKVANDPNAPGCTFTPTGGLIGTGSMSCTGLSSEDLDLEAYDNGMYGCVSVHVVGGYRSATVRNNRFLGGPNCVEKPSAIGVGYIGSAFWGYVLDPSYTSGLPSSSAVVCISTGPNAQGTDALLTGASSAISGIGPYHGGHTVTPGNTWTSDTCAAGYNPYMFAGGNYVNGAGNGQVQGSAASPILITQSGNTLTVTTTNGTIATGMTFMGENDSNDTIQSCLNLVTGAATCGGPGTYLITFPPGDTDSAPRTAFMFGPNILNSANEMLNISGTIPNVLVTQNLFDLGQVGALNIEAGNDAMLNVNGSGTIAVTYNAIINCNCRPVAFTFHGAGPYTAEVNWNYIAEWGLNAAPFHLEASQVFGDDPATWALYQYTGNTILTSADTSNDEGGETPFWINGGGSSQTITNAVVSFNVSIVNWSAPHFSNNPWQPKPGNPNYPILNGALTDVKNTAVQNFYVHDNWVDPTGTQGAGCVAYQKVPASSITNATYARNYNLVTGNPQATDGSNIWGSGSGLSATCQ